MAGSPTYDGAPTRFLIYGATGSGKSTLAARIAERTGLPWYSVDDLSWLPDWQQLAAHEQRRRFEPICAEDRWVLDTAYAAWLDLAWTRVQLVVALDYPRWVSFSRLLRRTVLRVVQRRQICNGNTETLRRVFSSHSILLWHVRTYAQKRKRIRGWAADQSGPAVILLTSPRATEDWLSTLDR